MQVISLSDKEPILTVGQQKDVYNVIYKDLVISCKFFQVILPLKLGIIVATLFSASFTGDI